MWFETWPLSCVSLTANELQEAVDAVIAKRGVVPAGRSRLRVLRSIIEVTVGFGDVHGTFTVELPAEDTPGSIRFESEHVLFDWEQAYRLFVDLALALRGAPEPMLASIEEMCLLDDEVEAELRALALAALERVDAVHGVVESFTRTTTWSPGAPNAEDDLVGHAIDVTANDGVIVVKARGAGDAFVLRIQGDTSHLGPDMLAIVRSTLHAESRMLFLRAAFGRRTALLPPRVDPSRAGAYFLEMRDEEGRLMGSAPARDLADLTRALVDYDVDLIRYFSDGAPFWRSAFERGTSVRDETLDSRHALRCWRWTPPATGRDAGVRPR